MVFDVAVIGAGAAGMFTAAVAGQRGLRVVLIDHARELAEKIRISGGGRCNFTNLGASHGNFLGRNPDFTRSALRAFGPQDFLGLLRRHAIGWHEKHRGQLFCDDSSQRIIDMLARECATAGVAWRMPCAVHAVARAADDFVLQTSAGELRTRQLVLASGGMALPQVGASDFSLRIARQFGLQIIEPRPALVPLLFDASAWRAYADLAGVSAAVAISHSAARAGARKNHQRVQRAEFLEDLLFTHKGLSGPAILQISSYWRPGEAIKIDLCPGQDAANWLEQAKAGAARGGLGASLGQILPRRLVEKWLAHGPAQLPAAQRLAETTNKQLQDLGRSLNHWELFPSTTAGYKKAEAMSGGIATAELDARSMQARRCPGLFVVGEAMDVTGWLGGYNFQWAWSSAYACGNALSAAP